MSQRPLNVGLIGGGGGAFIVQPHQKAIHFDGTRRVTCAALHPDPKAALKEAENWPYPLKGYPSYDELIQDQAKKPKGERVDYVVVVTPNHVHFDPAYKCVMAGIPVFCEKPLTLTLEESDKLVAAVKEKKVPFGVAHTYLGHWTSWFSRYIVRSGLLGDVRWVDSCYIQGWLAARTEDTGSMQAEWRVDPKRAGISCCGGDIGTHALMQLRFVTGLEVTELAAHLETFVKGRMLDDHFTVYVKLANGGRGLVRASQICIGHKNDLSIEVNGTKGSLIWRQEEPEKVVILLPGQPDRVYWRAAVAKNDGFLGDVPDWLLAEPTIPSGHPEAFHDAYARLHRSFEADVRAYNDGKPFACDGSKYANVTDGRIGIAFVTAAVESSKRGNVWVPMK
ncbi:MAG TPA: Gfo/Idh/MocA family oxidoreductase [Planctomycetota bacterium]|jgi:predicted dehydrogenase|nr:Gfo/Idh/MocA family oxidoreductase [Planctomycetota bacterium]OQC19377.1 MAG: 1,5-anhydro-D-fructose reductase [Planctomycetes bacterium ADurb.Bin069]NMD36895.1 Gfo/Idh/MocA family oxidoreductase [Planctomycetota bacterium]HNR99961.1 Gfo/Idh/MocA family oxidoreductase [Planctomycetota bacterium]HNU25669.1 Gfo/Idh/MocA family oxidoreductase [Planctomycetota bacterium]